MKKKIISFMLTAVLALSSVVCFSGCGGDNNYPVQIANITIKEQPEKIVVLDPYAADIISYMGYDFKMEGRSDEVDQEWMSIVPSFGSQFNPDVKSIVDSGAKVVFAGEDLDDSVKAEIEKEGITVIVMSEAKTPVQLETNYKTIGKIMEGSTTGLQAGVDAYADLIKDMEKVQDTVESRAGENMLYTVCYLFYEDDQMKMMTSGTYGDMLLGYTGAVNVAVNIDETAVDVNTLKIANPNFIFYSDEATLKMIKSDKVLASLNAVKKNKMLMITQEDMSRQGLTTLNTLNKMCAFMYPEIADLFSTESIDEITNVQNNTDATTAPEATQVADETKPTESVEATTVANSENSADDDTYGINLTADLSLKAEDENDDVKAMQKRLFDLGYVTDEENITGYYGEVSVAAVKDFQKNNGIEETGEADNATLVALFSDDAVKA